MSEQERAEALKAIQLELFQLKKEAIMKTPEEYKRMAVDAMVKYADNEEIYQLAKALEEVTECSERDIRRTRQEEMVYV